ncbi:hypothetical protein C8R21_11664 [Nitrosospira multiformis]|uniref:Uncharacterized protein n=1 Tax=Nitrosospira multiformis TaxID=1231 RepID=A0A2T5I9B9_9PROT|nr:hypothetical protein C8R21_11664 [Nitrosospira multiformis]
MKPPILNQPGMRYSINEPARKHYESPCSGPARNPANRNSAKPVMACFERHWIPASAGMTFVLLARLNQ